MLGLIVHPREANWSCKKWRVGTVSPDCGPYRSLGSKKPYDRTGYKKKSHDICSKYGSSPPINPSEETLLKTSLTFQPGSILISEINKLPFCLLTSSFSNGKSQILYEAPLIKIDIIGLSKPYLSNDSQILHGFDQDNQLASKLTSTVKRKSGIFGLQKMVLGLNKR